MSKILKIFKSLKQSSDAKKVGKNMIYLSILQIGGYLFPLLTMPYLARIIGVNGFGKIAFASAIITYIQTFTDWGFNYTTARDIAKNRDDLKKVEEIYSIVTWSRLILMTISMIVLFILVMLIPYLYNNALIIAISFILIPGHVLFPEWLFQGMEEMKYITILNFITKLVFTGLIFIFIKEPSDYILQPLFLGLGFIISAILGLIYIRKKWNIQLRKCSFKQIRLAIKNSTDVFINTLMPNFYNSFSVILLGFFGGAGSNGVFDGGNKFNNIIYQFLQIISRAFFPFLARKIDKHTMFVKISMVASITLTLLTIFLAPLLIDCFLSSSFSDSIIVLRIMALSIIFLTISNVYGTNYLVLVNKERILRNATIFASMIGFILSIPLVYLFSYIGAAITISLTRMILGLITYYCASKVKRELKLSKLHN